MFFSWFLPQPPGLSAWICLLWWWTIICKLNKPFFFTNCICPSCFIIATENKPELGDLYDYNWGWNKEQNLTWSLHWVLICWGCNGTSCENIWGMMVGERINGADIWCMNWYLREVKTAYVKCACHSHTDDTWNKEDQRGPCTKRSKED